MVCVCGGSVGGYVGGEFCAFGNKMMCGRMCGCAYAPQSLCATCEHTSAQPGSGPWARNKKSPDPGQEVKGADERQLAQEAGDVRVAAVADGAHGGRPGSETPTRGPAWAVPTQKAKHSSRRMVGAKGVRCPNLRPKAATLPMYVTCSASSGDPDNFPGGILTGLRACRFPRGRWG